MKVFIHALQPILVMKINRKIKRINTNLKYMS